MPLQSTALCTGEVTLTNMNPGAQRKALVASRKAASSVLSDAGDDKMVLIAVKAAPDLDVRKVISAEMAEIGMRSVPQKVDSSN